MRRILFILAIVIVAALATAPPIAAQPLLRPSPAILDARDEAERVAYKASQAANWFLGNDNGNDADESEAQATVSQE